MTFASSKWLQLSEGYIGQKSIISKDHHVHLCCNKIGVLRTCPCTFNPPPPLIHCRAAVCGRGGPSGWSQPSVHLHTVQCHCGRSQSPSPLHLLSPSCGCAGEGLTTVSESHACLDLVSFPSSCVCAWEQDQSWWHMIWECVSCRRVSMSLNC